MIDQAVCECLGLPRVEALGLGACLAPCEARPSDQAHLAGTPHPPATYTACLVAGQVLTTATGGLAVEDACSGTVVLSHTGWTELINDVRPRPYSGELLHVTPVSSGNTFCLPAGQQILALPGEQLHHPAAGGDQRDACAIDGPGGGRTGQSPRPTFLAADRLRAGDFLVFPKGDPHAASPPLAENFATLAGIFTATGRFTSPAGHRRLAFRFGPALRHGDQIRQVQSLCACVFGDVEGVEVTRRGAGIEVSVSTEAGYDALHQHLGAVPGACLSAQMTGQSAGFLLAFLSAYVAAEGDISSTVQGRWRKVTVASRQWAFTLQGLLARLDRYATITPQHCSTPRHDSMPQHGASSADGGRTGDRYQVQWASPAVPSPAPRVVVDAGAYFLVPIRAVHTETVTTSVFDLTLVGPHGVLIAGFPVRGVWGTDDGAASPIPASTRQRGPGPVEEEGAAL